MYPPEEQIVISAQNLSLSYVEGEPIIMNASFRVRKGEFVFITGPSGSGKSTLLKSFYGDIKPYDGDLVVANTPLNSISDGSLMTLRQHIGIVFQDYKLIKEWNIDKNVMLPLLIAGYSKRVCEAQVDKLLTHVDLYNKKGRFPMELSGGEQQRVAMARALAHNPTIILADEPTGNLDVYSSGVIWKLLAGANTQLETTIVVVTHDIPPELNVEYTHYSLHSGRLIQEDSRYGMGGRR
jgi:cell division transport system ATP-binding protein